MSDVEQLCARLRALGVDEGTVGTARRDLSAHAGQEGSWLQLAAHLRRIDQFDASLETYEIAARRFPTSARLWNNRGVLLREYNHLAKAISSFEKALELQPSYVLALESIAIAYERSQRFSTAAGYYRQALSLDAKRALCWCNLGNCLRLQSLRQEAVSCYEEAITLDPGYVDAMFNLASLQYEQKEYAAALRTVERCAVQSPSDPGIQALRDEIGKHPLQPLHIGPAPLEPGYVLRLSTNIDEQGNVVTPELNTAHVLSAEEILAMSREGAARVVGTRMWDQMRLRQLVQEAISASEPTTSSFSAPFISYRWGDPAHSEWVASFVRDLEERGYDVVFDRTAETERRPPGVVGLISRMAKCNLFVPMITEPYTRRVLVSPGNFSAHLDDGWVFDEWEIAKLLASAKRLRFVGIWVSGDDLPPPFMRDTVYDFRKRPRYEEEMDRIFPVRYVTVVGVRANDTFRALTRVKRSQAKEVVAGLQGLQEFEYVAIVESPAGDDDGRQG